MDQDIFFHFLMKLRIDLLEPKFSTLDMRSGYWQVPINPEDRLKITFCPGPDKELSFIACHLILQVLQVRSKA